MDKAAKPPSIVILFILICVGTIGGVLYTPALPTIMDFFKVTNDQVEFTMTVYLIGYAFGQLPYGPLSNRFGRRFAMRLGLSIAIFSALLSIFSYYFLLFPLFVFSRFLFAFGAASGIQVVFTMIGDAFRPPQSSKVASYLTLAFALGPSLGISIGGVLTQYLGWISCFYFLALYCALLMFLTMYLPETCLKKDIHALHIKNIALEYFNKFTKKEVMFGALLVGVAVAFSYIFATVAPFIAMEVIGLTPSLYGFSNLIPASGLVLGSFLSAYLSKKLQSLTTIRLATVIIALGSFPMFFLFLFDYVTFFSLFIPYTIALIAQPIIEANVICLILERHENKATTTSVINFVNLTVCLIFVFGISFPGSVVPLSMPTIFCILSLLIFCFYSGLKGKNTEHQ